ncbi:MAG: hypothetical protein K6B65_03365 [Bacilli bacterium]|nr:hypothetical protein [Bacilli bacterium]
MNKRLATLLLPPLFSLLFSCGGGSGASSISSTDIEESTSMVKKNKTLAEMVPFLDGLSASSVSKVKKEEGNMTVSSGIRHIEYSLDLEDISAVLSLSSLVFRPNEPSMRLVGTGYVEYGLEIKGEWKSFVLDSSGGYFHEGNIYGNEKAYVNFNKPYRKTFKLLSHTMEFAYHAYGQDDNILRPEGFEIDEVEFFLDPVLDVKEAEHPVFIGEIESFGEIDFYSKTLVSFDVDYSGTKKYYKVAGEHYFAFMFPDVG